MLCGSTPCVCVGKKSRPRNKNFRSSSSSHSIGAPVSEPAQPAPDMGERMRLAASVQAAQRARDATGSSEPATLPASLSDPLDSTALTVEELVEADAIRNLAPLLHPDELQRYSAIIASTPTPAERSAVWKYRRAHS